MPIGRTPELKTKALIVTSGASLGLPGLTNSTIGTVVPSYTAAEIANLTSAVDGTIVYDTDNMAFKGFANGLVVAMS